LGFWVALQISNIRWGVYTEEFTKSTVKWGVYTEEFTKYDY
jgi:hypothetical protein